MLSTKVALFLCFALVATPYLCAAAGVKHPLNIDVEHVARTLTSAERIAYGNAASAGQFPFIARLGWVTAGGAYTACGSTVITSTYLLTAAHCMFDESNNFKPPTVALLGGTDMSSLGNFAERIPILEAYVHPQYKAGLVTSNYDVAIVKLKTPTSYPAVNLATIAPDVGASLTSIGWGLTEKASAGVRNDQLLYTTLKVGKLGVGACPSCPQNPCTILCELGIPAGSGYTSACQGDSGGPQVLPGTTTQVSIVSFGPEGCGSEPWGASTSVAAVLPWINNIIGATPTPTPSPSPTPVPSPDPVPSPQPVPSPTTIPSPQPVPSPKPTGCTLDKTKGDIVQITYTAAACATDASLAAATAAAKSSGATSYCILAVKCAKIGTKIKISAKLALNVDRSRAKVAITTAFRTGTYSARFKALLPNSYKKYVFSSGTACAFPGPCVY